ncbi:MAG: methionine synthase [Pseudonocardiales bacterium]|nr:MAG: methionine synthase [Pseudonocardiales bacterium]
MTERLWPPGAATGLGSLPGTDPAQAARLVFDELPDLPHLPELPDRGAGAEMIGRTASLLVDLAVEVAPSGWRLSSGPGRDLRRAQDFLARDLDALEAAGDGYVGALKVQVSGPWTLAANIEVPSGHRVVGDPGATRDLAESLAEGLRAHLADIGSRLAGARLVVQLDEPGLPAVLAGHVATPSGFGSVRAVTAEMAEQVLRSVLDIAPAGGRVVHCCATDVPIAMMRAAGANAVAVDLALLGSQYDALGEALDAGTSLWLGVLPTADTPFTPDTAREPIRRLWNALGFPVEQLAASVVPTPACGLAGATPDYARRVLSTLRDVAQQMIDI